MKTRMKAAADGILILLIIMVVLRLSNNSPAHASGKDTSTELLIAIDNSGSMKENLEFLDQVVNLIKLLAEQRGADVMISYLLFNENVLITDTFDEIEIVSGKETCIMQGIEAADRWMTEKIENGKSVKVLFISDLFSSRYLDKENGKVKIYDMNRAEEEQMEILKIENKWAEWCKAKKATVLIWTWDSFCKTEKVENTLDNLKENKASEISIGYQVKFKPDKNVEITNNLSAPAEKDTEFIKQTIHSFETLLGSSNVKWENKSYVVNPEETRTLTLKAKDRLIYLFFPKTNNVRVTYNGNDVETKYNDLYILDKKESSYSIIGKSGSGKSEGFLLKIPDLKWEISLSDTLLKKSDDFAVILSPSESLGGSWGDPGTYNCILRIKDSQNNEIYNGIFEYDYEKSVFFLEHSISISGWYTFIGEVNGDEIDTIKRKVN